MWFYFLFGTIIIAMGLIVHKGKAYFLISGYNTYTKEKKKNVDVESIAKRMGYWSYINGGVAYLGGILTGLGVNNLMGLVLGVFAVSTVILLVTLQKFDHNMFDERGRLKGEGRKQLTIGGIITVISLLLVGVLLFFSTRPTAIVRLEDSIEIKGMYGEEIHFEDIETVELMENLPVITRRTNGSAVGSKLKGYFATKDYGSMKLFLDKSKPPYIFIQTPKRKYLFNLENEDLTNETYQYIIENLE